MKVLAIFGTRPEAIKMMPIINALAKNSFFETRVCVTAQHRCMLDQVLSLYKLSPDYDLNIMGKNQSLTSILFNVMNGLETVLVDFQPDWVLVQGDTSTTFAASLAAFYKKIPVAHIEAGLRTRDIYSPWPEEMNRQLTTRIASLHLAPTDEAKNNLIEEHVSGNIIFVTGNTVIDALLETVAYINFTPHVLLKLQKQFAFIDTSRKVILVTSHRRENFGKGLKQMCLALLELSIRDDIQIIYPVHMNPNVAAPVNQLLGNKQNIYLLSPQEYLPFVYLMTCSYLILTDSGGIQEEAPSLGKPVLVARDTTERPEGVKAGTAKLVGTNKSTIMQSIVELIDNTALYERMSKSQNPYGDGKASEKIVATLQKQSEINNSKREIVT